MNYLRTNHVLFSTQDPTYKAIVTLAAWPHDTRITVVPDPFETLLNNEKGDSLFDCLILDTELDVVAELRQLNFKQPILSLVRNPSARARIAAFEMGSDDCMGPSFSVSELITRTRGLCRRKRDFEHKSKPETEDLSLCFETQTARHDDKNIHLTETETKILRLFLENQGRVLSPGYLGRAVWGESAEVSRNLISVHLAHLRQKLLGILPFSPIRTVHGQGYVLPVKSTQTQI